MKTAIVLAVILLAEVLVTAAVFAAFEHISYGEGFYWASETGSTVGYGDVVPRTAAGHVTALVAMYSVIPTMGALFGRLAALHIVRHVRRQQGQARQIAADTYKAVTGQDHPEAP